MAPERSGTHREHTNPEPRVDGRSVTDSCLLVRNYDGTESHQVSIEFVDTADQPVFGRTITVTPLETATVEARLPRQVYRVTATVDGAVRDSANCLIGSGPNELARVGTGNGTVSVVDGQY